MFKFCNKLSQITGLPHIELVSFFILRVASLSCVNTLFPNFIVFWAHHATWYFFFDFFITKYSALYIQKSNNFLKFLQDAVNWLPNWTPSPHFVEDVNRILQENDSWIIDGNNEKVRETVWATAEAVIWLDYSFLTGKETYFVRGILILQVIWRLIKRTAARLLFNQTLWNGNHERWRVALSWNSVVLWGVTMWFRYKTGIDTFSEETNLTDIRIPWVVFQISITTNHSFIWWQSNGTIPQFHSQNRITGN